jgi:hypothetical protein
VLENVAQQDLLESTYLKDAALNLGVTARLSSSLFANGTVWPQNIRHFSAGSGLQWG